MPVGLIDTGFNDALTRGLSLGLQFTTAQEQRDERRLERERRKQEYADQQAQQKFNNDIRSSTLAIAMDKMTRQRQAEEAAQAGNIAMFDSLDRRPDPTFEGPVTPNHPAPQVGGLLGIARETFAAAPSGTQQQMLAPTLQEMRSRQAREHAANIRRELEDERLQNKVRAIEAMNASRKTKDRLISRVMTGYDPGDEFTAEEWQQSPLFQSMTPEFQQQSLMEVQATGKFPRRLVDEHQQQALGLAPTPRLNANDPALFAIDTDIEAAKFQQQTATLAYRAAIQARNGFMAGQDAGFKARYSSGDPRKLSESDMTVVRALGKYNTDVAQAKKDLDGVNQTIQGLMSQKSGIARALGQDQPRPRVMPQAAPQSAPPPRPTSPGQQAPTMQTPTNPAAQPASAMTPGQGSGGMDDIMKQIDQLRNDNPGITDEELEEMMLQLLEDPEQDGQP